MQLTNSVALTRSSRRQKQLFLFCFLACFWLSFCAFYQLFSPLFLRLNCQPNPAVNKRVMRNNGLKRRPKHREPNNLLNTIHHYFQISKIKINLVYEQYIPLPLIFVRIFEIVNYLQRFIFHLFFLITSLEIQQSVLP